MTSFPSNAHTPVRRNPRQRSPLLTLGKATVFLYVILLLAAVISARALPRSDDTQPDSRATEIAETRSLTAST